MRGLFLALVVLLVAFAPACNKDDVIQETDSAPMIELDSESGVYTVKVGRELSIAPTFMNADHALYAWTINGKLVSKDPTLSYRWEETGTVFVSLRVDTEKGFAEEELRVEVVELTPPVVSVVVPAKGLKVVKGTEYTITPDIQHKDLEGFRMEWVRDGQVVSTDTCYTFNGENLGEYSITINASNADGKTTRELKVEVVETIPYSISFPTRSYGTRSTDRYTFPGRPIYLRPLLEYYENPTFDWSVNGESVDEHGRVFKFTPTAAGAYDVICRVRENRRPARVTRNITRGGVVLVAALGVYCEEGSEEKRRRDGGNGRFSNVVYEYVPAPGQFINETGQFGGMTGRETTLDAANAWAAQRLRERKHVSLGSFGGYIVVGFDHSVVNRNSGYDFAIQGNAFDGSSEPGVVWVMQDVNGNGLPDDEWYELKGSETGKESTIQHYEVTYYKPAGKGMDVQWEASDGRRGCVDYLAAYHRQDYYYPAWVKEPSYTLIGTCIGPRNVQNKRNGHWYNGGFDWGYVDNMGSDDLPGGNTVDGSGQRNGFKISNAMNDDGTPANLKYIDFIKVQCAVLAKSGWLGENSTEVCAFEDLSK